MDNRKLKTGVAYHGNRMPSHYREDLKEIVRADMDIVVHMFSHTDWDRHKTVMGDIFKMTEDAGMEVWVDNWGLGGPPGDKSHFLAYHPESHIIYSNGEMAPVNACLNSPDFRAFVKEWIDTVYALGGRTIFWDEPFLPTKKTENGLVYGCCCKTCRKKFEARYNKPMPAFLDADAADFRTETIVDYFKEITAYSASLGIRNVVCVMLGANLGINLDTLDRLCSLDTVENVGSDPYWYGKKDVNPYEFVYRESKKNLDISERFGKDHNLWIQTYHVPNGREEEIIPATQAAYDAGARTILAWGYMGSESNDYRANNPLRTWNKTVEAFRRIREEDRNRLISEYREKYRK
ncbi:MAG: hypothetical protein PT951_05155 [Eubacteriales bacterium]|nr:hypothetical protein [Eubacteriales bacterium]